VSPTRIRSAVGIGLRAAIGRRARPHWRIPIGPARGLRLEFDPGAPLDLWLGLYEYELVPHLRELCGPGTSCFDIGSHDGYYALLLARMSGAPVLAFDSDPDSCARVRRNRDANPPLAPLVDVRLAYVAFERNPDVNAVTLDDLVDSGEAFVPGLIKLDVDRAEASVLFGARRLLAERRPHVLVETHSPELERECGELLAGIGYNPIVVTQRRLLAENRPIAHNRWLVARGR
jgi:hypothetical protein